jgi:hypothetical protein
MKPFAFVAVTALGLSLACTPATPAPVAAPTVTPVMVIVSPSGYRPLQMGDPLEGVSISYQYVLPSVEKPVVVFAFGPSLMQLVIPKPELITGVVSFIQEIQTQRDSLNVYAFDEADPGQTEPKQLAIDMRKPVEIAFLPLQESGQVWSVTESQDGMVRTGYKLVRRKDGGLRFIDAYDPQSLNSFTIVLTRNGSGAGLVFSARVALMKLILSDPAYQRGADVLANNPPSVSAYDARILRLDTTRTGLDQNMDWALVSRPGPNTGIVTP